MTADARTLDFYNANAPQVAAKQTQTAPHTTVDIFLAALPPGGSVLDLGCGAAWAAAEMAQRGFDVTAVDGAQGMVAEARRLTGLDVRLLRFDELEDIALYDGVFASFSLLHAPREEAPDLLARVRRALKPGGVLFVSVKTSAEGSVERRDRLGRFYADYAPSDLEALIVAAGMTVEWIGDGKGVDMDDVESRHVYLLARRPDTE
ncbi:MAG: class I SAM-dependent methyltransferase [Neomegalonema sp.]|nr:class I SAM-dependent methyltransferase [Neomegalonema sp.]